MDAGQLIMTRMFSFTSGISGRLVLKITSRNFGVGAWEHGFLGVGWNFQGDRVDDLESCSFFSSMVT